MPVALCKLSSIESFYSTPITCAGVYKDVYALCVLLARYIHESEELKRRRKLGATVHHVSTCPAAGLFPK